MITENKIQISLEKMFDDRIIDQVLQQDAQERLYLVFEYFFNLTHKGKKNQ